MFARLVYKTRYESHCGFIYPFNIVSTYKINNKNIVAAVQEKNIYGFQFHPEKSSFEGLNLIKEFISL